MDKFDLYKKIDHAFRALEMAKYAGLAADVVAQYEARLQALRAQLPR